MDNYKSLSGPKRVLESLFIVIVFVSAFMLVSLFSHNDADPSWSQTGFDVQNLMGAAGANVSDVLLFWLGYGSIAVPFTLLYLGFCFFIKDFNFFEVDFFTVGLRIMGYCFLLVSVLALLSMNILNNDTFQSGGIIGGIICSFVISIFGELGASLVFLALFLIGVPFFTGISWLSVCDVLGELFFTLVFFRSNLERRKAEKQLARMAKYRNTVVSDGEDEGDSGELTVFDPETGFSIYLRDDAEIKYDGSCYDDDDYPKIREQVVRHQVAPAEAFVTPRREPMAQQSQMAVKSSSDAQSLKTPQIEVKTRSVSMPESPVASSPAVASTSSEFQMPKFTVYDEDDQNNSNVSGNKASSASIASSAAPVSSAPSPDQPFCDQRISTEEKRQQSAPLEIDLSGSNRTSVRDLNHQEGPEERVDVWNFTEDEDRSRNDTSYQTTNNIGAFVPEDPNEAINRAADAAGFDDDIPPYLAPGQKSVLDEDDEGSYRASHEDEHIDFSESQTSKNNSGSISSGYQNTREDDKESDASVSFDNGLTPEYLNSLRGKYDPDNLPPTSILNPVPPKPAYISQEELDFLSRRIEEKLRDFRIEAKVCGAEPGPVITRYALELSPGTKAKAISNISSDLARVLAVQSVRVVEIIPGTTYVGLEIANSKRQTVYFREVIDSDIFQSRGDKLTCGLGCSVVGSPVVMNLAKMPHLLVAGTTGSGKSVGVNGMILSMLFKSTPDDLRLIMIDPKMLEFSSYNNIPHLLTEVVTDMKDASNALRWCVGEMERRYKLMMKLNVKKIDEYNEKVLKAIDFGEPILDPLWERTAQLSDKRPYLGKLPYIVVVIDELADMMMQVGKKVEELIARLAQKARAAGIHLIIATQTPRADVLTGIIKSNIPSRLAFTVSNGLESRIIIEQQGAETLLGNGDMLFNPTGSNTLSRIHGAYVSPAEIDRVVNFWRDQGSPEYVDNIFDDEVTDENALPSEKAEVAARSSDGSVRDELFDEAVKVILQTQKASTSILQRKMGIGYPRAAKLIDSLEEEGIISAPVNSAGKRRILIQDHISPDEGDY